MRALLALAVAAGLAGCAHTPPVPSASWLPATEAQWTVRDAERADSVSWVAYDRKAPGMDVKEIRVIGLVNADPATTMRALRHRLLAEEFVPEGLELEVLEESKDMVLTYGLARLPWPLRDREVTERMRFSHDSQTNVFRVDVESVDTNEAVPRGVVRVERVRNTFVVEPVEGGSRLTTTSLHDMGGGFPNRAIYAPVRKGLVQMVFEVRELSARFVRGASAPGLL